MYNILIVQQNEQKMNNIRKAITENIHDVNVMYAYSGAEALEVIYKEKPHIVFLTIEMIDISGIDVASEVSTMENAPHIVFTSQYDYFEFARKSLQIGVSDYLLEPISEHDIVEVVSRLLIQVKDRIKSNEEELQKEKLFDDMYELSQISFVYNVAFGGKTGVNKEDYEKILNLSDRGFWLGIEIEEKPFEQVIEYKTVNRLINKCISNECDYVIGPGVFNRIMLFVPIKDDYVKNGEKSFSIRITQKLSSYISKQTGRNIFTGLGSVQKLEKLSISYEEAMIALRNEDTCLKKNSNKEFDYKVYIEKQKKMVEKIELGKDDMLDDFLSLIHMSDNLEITKRKNLIIGSLTVACNTVNSLVEDQYEFFNYMKMFEDIYSLKNHLNVKATEWFEMIVSVIKRRQDDKISDTVKTAMNYIHENYNKNISLNDMAGMVGVSLQYFSKIFKDETGYNFVEWVNVLRITKAKELMNTTQLTIKEVCFRVGYNDPNYFSRIFKRYEKIAPTEYVNSKKEQNNNG